MISIMSMSYVHNAQVLIISTYFHLIKKNENKNILYKNPCGKLLETIHKYVLHQTRCFDIQNIYYFCF